jgi:hypothetical protein
MLWSLWLYLLEVARVLTFSVTVGMTSGIVASLCWPNARFRI